MYHLACYLMDQSILDLLLQFCESKQRVYAEVAGNQPGLVESIQHVEVSLERDMCATTSICSH